MKLSTVPGRLQKIALGNENHYSVYCCSLSEGAHRCVVCTCCLRLMSGSSPLLIVGGVPLLST